MASEKHGGSGKLARPLKMTRRSNVSSSIVVFSMCGGWDRHTRTACCQARNSPKSFGRYVRIVHEVNVRGTDLNVLEVTSVSDYMPMLNRLIPMRGNEREP